MKFDLRALQWTRAPRCYRVEDGRIELVTEPHTDLWQRTYYHFRNDNAPVLQMTTREKYFSFVVKTEFSDSHHRFDQCGVAVYLDSDNWIKASIEYENDRFQHLGSVVTDRGYSDWATTEIPADIKSMWYRLSRRADDFCIECSRDGVNFHQMRVAHLTQAREAVGFGVYACSPEDSSFRAVFTDLQLMDCQWAAHNGQAPDAAGNRSNREIVEKFFEDGYVTHDFDSVLDLVAEDYLDHSPCAARSSRDCVNILRTGAGLYGDLDMKILDLLEDQDRVTVRVAFSWTHQAPSYDLPATGRRVHFEALEIFRIENGKIAESWGYWPDASIRQQLTR